MCADKKTNQRISLDEICKLWTFKPTKDFIQKFNATNLDFENVPDSVTEELFQKAEFTLGSELKKAGAHRLNEWESGWQENLEEYKDYKNDLALMPKYFRGKDYIRWKRKWIKPLNPFMEVDLLELLIESLLDTFVESDFPIYEFGCGTGRNLIQFRRKFPKSQLYGLDWSKSSQKIIQEYSSSTLDNNMHSHNFNFFQPDFKFQLKENAVVITIAALEQTGTEYKKFLDYLIEMKPRIVINIEPMSEFLDSRNRMDDISIRYFEKRNYLQGFRNSIEKLQETQKISIIKSFRSYIGSFYIEGYSVLVWKPNF